MWWALAGAVALASIVAEIVAHDDAHVFAWWHAIPAFDLIYGFIGCLAIVVASKALGKAWLQRPEEYYEERR